MSETLTPAQGTDSMMRDLVTIASCKDRDGWHFLGYAPASADISKGQLISCDKRMGIVEDAVTVTKGGQKWSFILELYRVAKKTASYEIKKIDGIYSYSAIGYKMEGADNE